MKTRKQNIKGGKVIASGSYGCVFDPALKCNDEKKRETKKITKLMTNTNAAKEFVEIAYIHNKLKKQKNYKDYFLTYDTTMCTPSNLTTTDLENFTRHCKILPNITRTNINTHLDEITALNIPNGGLPVDDYISENWTLSNIYKLHKSLVKLLKKGIVPMNKKHLFHSDIKDTNVLVDEKTPELKTRLIDWGLFTEYKPNENFQIPKNWYNKPLLFNVPFSVILFTDKFNEQYITYLKAGGEPVEEQLKPFIIGYINFWMKHKGAGHYKFINEQMFDLFKNDLQDEPPEKLPEIVETQITMDYLVNYLVDVLVHFTKPDGTFNLNEYIDTVYINIVDIWGFITIYYPIIEMLSNQYSKLNKNEIKLFDQIKFIFVNYLYNSRHEPIDMNELYLDLNIVGKILHKIINSNLNTYKSESSSPSDIETSIVKKRFSSKIQPKTLETPNVKKQLSHKIKPKTI
jgi:serine/threonine protein kinase